LVCYLWSPSRSKHLVPTPETLVASQSFFPAGSRNPPEHASKRNRSPRPPPPQRYLLRRRRLLLPPSLGKEALALLGLYLFATKNRIDSNPLGSRSASLAVCSQGCRAAGAVVAPSSAASAHRILAVRFHTGSGEQIGGLLSRCPAF
jgi:hypothetical protein